MWVLGIEAGPQPEQPGLLNPEPSLHLPAPCPILSLVPGPFLLPDVYHLLGRVDKMQRV